MRNKANQAYSEALLRQAVIENYKRELSAIPSDEQLAQLYAFSKHHETRMRRLFVRERRRTFSRVALFYLKRALAVLLIAVTLVFGLLMLNPNVRAAVRDVIIEWHDKFTSFTFSGEIADIAIEWRPIYLPEGFVESEVLKYGAFTDIIYTNHEGVEIRFSFTDAHDGFSASIDNENRLIESVEINGIDAFVMTSLSVDVEHGIIWNSGGYFFELWSFLSISELQRIAESVTPEK